ncbi:MAG: type II secretion system protein N [Gallionellaceae bacterium]|jgi:general secretion pathway protein N|nr:type II secretion system protein N [Gallionellaceae bacterium]
MSKRLTVLLFALVYLAVLIAFAPASLLDAALRKASHDRFALANASGTVWSGQALLSLRQHNGKWAPLQSMQWSISALSLFTGQIRAQLLPEGLPPAAATELVATRSGVELHHAQFQLSAQALNQISTTLEPIGFHGQLVIRSDHFALTPSGAAGTATVEWLQAGSALSRIAPLGNYKLTLTGAGAGVNVSLATTSGVLLLDGQGSWKMPDGLNLLVNARAAPGSEESLNELLYHFGPQTAPGVHTFNLVPQ